MFRPSRAVPSFSTSTATAIISPASSAAFATSSPTGPGSSRCPIAAMPARAGSRASSGLLQDAAAAYAFTTARYQRGQASSSGAFRSAPALRWRWRRSSRIGKLILEAPYTSTADVAASLFWFAPVRLLMRDQFRSDERIARVKVPLLDHAWRARSRDSHRLWRAAVCAGERAEAVRPLCPEAVTTNLDNFGAIETARNFINAARG